MGDLVINSQVLRQSFEFDVLPLRFSNNIEDLEVFNFQKVLKFLHLSAAVFAKGILNRPDFVYFTFSPRGIAFARDLIFIALIRLLRLPCLFHIHGKSHMNNSSRLSKMLYRWAFNAGRVILLSPRLYDEFSHVIDKGNCCYLENGIVDNGAEELETGESKYVLFFSNMDVSKGILVLLKALRELRDSGTKVTSQFAGQWGSREQETLFCSSVKELNLEDVVCYRGPLYGREKHLAFKNAGVMVLPSFNDAFPLVLLEAMSYGVPVIGTYEGGIPDIVADGETGFLIQKNDHVKLAEKIALLLSDEDLRRRMGAAARKRFQENFTSEIFIGNLARIFGNMASDYRRTSR